MLAEAPASLAPTIGMGEFQGRLWVATASGLFFYRPSSGLWDGFADAPAGLKTAVVAGGNTYALCKTANGLEVYQLAAAE